MSALVKRIWETPLKRGEIENGKDEQDWDSHLFLAGVTGVIWQIAPLFGGAVSQAADRGVGFVGRIVEAARIIASPGALSDSAYRNTVTLSLLFICGVIAAFAGA